MIDPSSGTLELWKYSNLTFGGYLASTTPMSSVKSFLFVLQVLLRACKDYVAHWWFFGIISWRRLWEKTATCNHITASRTKSCMVLTHLMEKRSGRRTTHDYPRETSSDSCCGRGTPYSAKPWPGRATASKERKTPHSRGGPRRYQCWAKRTKRGRRVVTPQAD